MDACEQPKTHAVPSLGPQTGQVISLAWQAEVPWDAVPIPSVVVTTCEVVVVWTTTLPVGSGLVSVETATLSPPALLPPEAVVV
jgi:hypothetical protein